MPVDERSRDTTERPDGSSEPSERVRSAPGVPSGYQPALDGIRAIAVILVVLYHLSVSKGTESVLGGWLGVDIFFVLSGYLITALLLAERSRRGRIGLGRFYMRRILRLAPLSMALVLLCLAIYLLGFADATGLHTQPLGALSIVLYYANWWWLIKPGSTGSMAHAWSLSIEEQFYFIWPWIVVAAIALFRGRSRQFLIGLTTAGIVAMGLYRRALYLAAVGDTTNVDAVGDAWNAFYFSSFQRPDGLLFGCLLALVLVNVRNSRNIRRIATIGGIIGAGLATYVIVRASTHQSTFWLGFVAEWGLSLQNLGITAVIAWLVVVQTSLFARVLSLRSLCWIGRRAYGIYLIQPLVLTVVAHWWHFTGIGFDAVVAAGSLAVAGLSFRYFETPFLDLKERFSWRGETPSESTSSR